MRHLYSNTCHDEAEVWCGDPDYYRDLVQPTRKPDECDCHACLDAVLRFAAKAMTRKFDLVDQRIAAMKTERRNSWPTEHEGDCPALELGVGACRCPMGNL